MMFSILLACEWRLPAWLSSQLMVISSWSEHSGNISSETSKMCRFTLQQSNVASWKSTIYFDVCPRIFQPAAFDYTGGQIPITIPIVVPINHLLYPSKPLWSVINHYYIPIACPPYSHYIAIYYYDNSPLYPIKLYRYKSTIFRRSIINHSPFTGWFSAGPWASGRHLSRAAWNRVRVGIGVMLWGSVVPFGWLVVWNIFYFPIYWEQSSQLTNIFQRGSNHQPAGIIWDNLDPFGWNNSEITRKPGFFWPCTSGWCTLTFIEPYPWYAPGDVYWDYWVHITHRDIQQRPAVQVCRDAAGCPWDPLCERVAQPGRDGKPSCERANFV